MTRDPRTEPLLEWNRLARENAENAIVSSMFEAALKASAPIDAFSTWLLIGSAAIASFFIANADKLIPFIGRAGFLTAGAFLCASCAIGLLSKIYAVRCQVAGEVGQAVRTTFAEHLRVYEQEEKKIQDGAEFWGITLQTGLRADRLLSEFYAPMPKFVAWLARRHLVKNAGNPQVGYLLHIGALNKQGQLAFLQAAAFLGFLASGFICAAAA